MMKNRRNTFAAFALIACFMLATSCATYNNPGHGGIPPGQAKKITGSKSAKPYAPGQQKKKH